MSFDSVEEQNNKFEEKSFLDIRTKDRIKINKFWLDLPQG